MNLDEVPPVAYQLLLFLPASDGKGAAAVREAAAARAEVLSRICRAADTLSHTRAGGDGGEGSAPLALPSTPCRACRALGEPAPASACGGPPEGAHPARFCGAPAARGVSLAAGRAGPRGRDRGAGAGAGLRACRGMAGSRLGTGRLRCSRFGGLARGGGAAFIAAPGLSPAWSLQAARGR